jgi:predicted RNase H-like HicB family nuclease
MPEHLKRVAIHRETLTTGERVYVARDLNLPTLMAHGSTTDEAAENLEDARALYRSTQPTPPESEAGAARSTVDMPIRFDSGFVATARTYSRP